MTVQLWVSWKTYKRKKKVFMLCFRYLTHDKAKYYLDAHFAHSHTHFKLNIHELCNKFDDNILENSRHVKLKTK